MLTLKPREPVRRERGAAATLGSVGKDNMTAYSTIAAVDLGSNSFRLQVVRVVDEQIYPLDSLKETVRLAAGLTPDKQLDADSQTRGLECLKRFGERLRGLPRDAVRAVGTNTLRVAKNGGPFLKAAQKALGFPVEVVAGHEEARLIYLGVSHSLSPSAAPRLVVDIGGGSTELIVGTNFEPVAMESLYMGCVSFSQRFFGNGKLSGKAMREAEVAAGAELQTVVHNFSRERWVDAVGSSGTARAIGDILEQNGWSASGITAAGLAKLRKQVIDAGEVKKLNLTGLRDDRKPVLPGGLAIMLAVFGELGVEQMQTTESGLRDGVLWDMLGRFQHRDVRDATVRQFMQRHQVDQRQAARVEKLTRSLYRQFAGEDPDAEHTIEYLAWAARLHEIGISIAYASFHKHSAYILENADMPGFSKMEQRRLARYVLAQRGSLAKVPVEDAQDWLAIFCLRIAVLFYRGRADLKLPDVKVHHDASGFHMDIDEAWMERNPLTHASLEAETKIWKSVGLRLEFGGIAAVNKA
jgi:exopolyphosphatase / guanosine-5'-triphosphate,3'-diphosphate pyrophosphatase